MRLALIATGTGAVVTSAYANGANRLPTLVLDRQADGAAFPGERVVRLPRRFARMWPTERARILGRWDGIPTRGAL